MSIWLSALVVTAAGLVYVYKSGASSKKTPDVLIPNADKTPEENPLIHLQEATETLHSAYKHTDNLTSQYLKLKDVSVSQEILTEDLIGEIPIWGKDVKSPLSDPHGEISKDDLGRGDRRPNAQQNSTTDLWLPKNDGYAMGEDSMEKRFTELCVKRQDLNQLTQYIRTHGASNGFRQIRQS